MEQTRTEVKEGKLDRVQHKIKLLIIKSSNMLDDINRFSNVTFGFGEPQDEKCEDIQPKCVTNKVLSDLCVLDIYLDSISRTIIKLNQEVCNEIEKGIEAQVKPIGKY
ncbi:MAG: hypothetical protein KAX49_03955 [Halanaerobiales bacterium]|nr:hypothetical protein [Halanaerobiales bacterium]